MLDTSFALNRLSKLRAKYVTTARDADLRTTIDILLANRKVSQQIAQPLSRMGMLVTADSGAGKTTSLSRAIHRHPDLQPGSEDELPAVCFRVESPVTLKGLALQMLRQLGYPVQRTATRADYWVDVRHHLQLRQTQLIWLDEGQDVFQGRSAREAAEVLSTLKGLMSGPEWPVVLVLTGVPELAEYCDQDRQLMRRMYPMSLEPISVSVDGPAVRNVIAEYCSVADVTFDLPEDLVGRLIHATSGRLGTSLELIVDALQDLFLSDGQVLTIDNFVRAYQMQKNCPAPLNVFLAPAWQSIGTQASQTLAATTVTGASRKADKKRKYIERSKGPW